MPAPGRRTLLFLLLALTLLRGIVYLVVFPPWQHYDEPTHFEYVRLIAERGRLPKYGDYDVTMRQEIASSMQAAGFWKGTIPPPIPFWTDEPAWLGMSELDHPPLYYIMVALPQLLVQHQSAETQLYLARLTSVLLNLIVVASTYCLVTELFPERRWLPLAVATFVVLLPPFTDLMSAVNNDTGAAAAGSLLLLASARLIRRGASVRRAMVILLLAGICIGTKSTAGVVAVAVLLTLVAGFIPRAYRRWLWIGLGALTATGLALGITWGGHAARWYSTSPPAAANRSTETTPFGDSTLVLSTEDRRYGRQIVQELPRSNFALQDGSVTFGTWLRAPEDSDGLVTLYVDDGLHQEYLRVSATSEWQFRAVQMTLEPGAAGIAVSAFIPDRDGAAKTVYLDGAVLAGGRQPVDVAPEFRDARCSEALWDDAEVSNLLRNGSAESGWPGLRPWLGNLSLLGQPAATAFHSLLDWSRTRWAYAPDLRTLVDSFWGTFGWNHLSVSSPVLVILRILSAVAVLGMGLGLLRRGRSGRWGEAWQRRGWAVLASAVLASWGTTVLRIHPIFLTRGLFIPVARYSAVVIAPTALGICLGLAELLPRPVVRAACWAGMLGLIALDALSLVMVIIPYYYG